MNKRVLVLLHRPADHPRTAQGLRAALGYVTADLRVTVVLCGPAGQVLDRCGPAGSGPQALRRPVDLLRALGHEVLSAAEVDLAVLGRAADAIVTW